MSKHVQGLPRKADKYYEACKKRYGETSDVKSYCARVAWNIYCSHVDPNYPSCTKFGKTWGKPYSDD